MALAPLYLVSTNVVYICPFFLRIIDPITSRCAKFRFKPLPGPSVIRRLEDVCEAENIKIRPEVCRFQFPKLRFCVPESILFSVLRVLFALEFLSRSKHYLQALASLVDVSSGDLRKAINLLQSAQRMHPQGGDITHLDIVEVACVRLTFPLVDLSNVGVIGIC